MDALLNAIIRADMNSDTGPELPPGVFNQIAKFTEYDICVILTSRF
jgi:hypothetical protein